jgi:hypothetical protein
MTLTHQEVCQRGGQNSWKNKSKEERKKIMIKRWEVRRKNKAVDNG